MVGAVRILKTFKNKSYGWIYGSDKKLYFFHENENLNIHTLNVRDRVQFDAMGEKAINVQKLSV